jgi:uncharacterized protein involved in outer membrane biogenesis
MKRNKIVLIIAAVIIAVIAALVILTVTNLDQIVKTAIERYGSDATGTSVHVGSVKIELAKGTAAVSRLTVANPPGFSAPHLLSLGSISVTVEPRTATSPVIVIDEVRLTGPQVTYERNDKGQANVDVIRRNLGSAGPAKPAEDKSTRGSGKKLRIKKLVVENGTVEVRIAGLDEKPRTATLGRIELHDIGGASGATPDQAARQVITAVLSETSRQAVQAGATKMLEKGLQQMMQGR